MTIFGNELAPKLAMASDALEATSVPRLTKRRQYRVLNRSMALCTMLSFHTFVVVWFAVQNHVLACDTSVTPAAGQEITRAGRAVDLRVMVIIGS